METQEKLKSEIDVLESILREKRQRLKVVKAIEAEKELLWRCHVANAPPEMIYSSDLSESSKMGDSE